MLCPVAAACTLAGSAFGQEPAVKPIVRRLLTDATRELNRALTTTNTAAALGEFRQVVANCEDAIHLQPDSFDAHFLLASCLFEVVKRSVEGEKRRSLARAAREQFLISMRCPGADWRPYLLGSQFTVREIGNLAKTPAEKAALVGESRKALETGMGLTTNISVRARFEGELANVIMMELEFTADPSQQRALSEQAIKLLESASNAQGDASPALWDDVWGVALIKLGKLDNDPARFQQAIDRLHRCLTRDPGRVPARYNLACGYALIGQPELAMTHLATCLDTEMGKKFHRSAREDPDLTSVRNLPEAAPLFAQPGKKVSIPVASPGISNR
jgi:tetratricopeptide (TPR) repeat protein